MHQYEWAVNKLKLVQAASTLEAKKKLDARVIVNEETIKEQYVRAGGLLVQFKPSIESGKVVRPIVPPIKEQLADLKAENEKEKETPEQAEAIPSEPEVKKTKKSKAE